MTPSEQKQLSAGLWRVPITPPLDSPVVGGVDPLEMGGILDDLYANAVVFDDGESEIAIVSVDVIGIPNAVVKDILLGIEAHCGIPAGRVTISATHTHKGPPIRVSDARQQADPYTENFKKLVVTSVYMAQKKKQPVRIGVGRRENRDFIFNRRLKKPDGSVVMNWVDWQDVADCTGDGPVDPEMLVLKIETPDLKPVGFVLNYANHNNALPGSAISADIAGHMGELLRRLYGRDIVTVFLLGTCGNVNWLNYQDHGPADRRRHPTHYQEIATSLTGTVLEILPKMEFLQGGGVQTVNKVLQISERPFEPYDTKVDFTYGRLDGDDSTGFFERMHGKAKQESEGRPLMLYDVDIHATRLGDEIAIVTLPGELFVEFGLGIKAKSPFKYTFVAELTNGSVGYIPTRKAYEEGGYEVRKPANRMEKDAGERMTTAALSLLHELKG